MTHYETDLRILGPPMGLTESYIDVTIDGIDLKGRVYLTKVDGTEEYVIDSVRLQELHEEDMAVSLSSVPESPLWATLDGLTDARNDPELNSDAHMALENAQRSVFAAIMY